MYAKLHETKEYSILACCDIELIGKTLKEKDIEMNVSENFYKEKEVNEIELKKLLKKANNINLLGKKCVKVALTEGFINKKDIIKISGVPHVQIYKF